MIPYSRQSISEQDIEEVVQVLRSDMITQGPVNKKFEEEICSHTTCKYSVLTNSATSALHLACLALGLGSDDILWTSPNSYVASANVGLFCNAHVDFVDIVDIVIISDIADIVSIFLMLCILWTLLEFGSC